MDSELHRDDDPNQGTGLTQPQEMKSCIVAFRAHAFMRAAKAQSVVL
ncbi:hypothetical protein ARSEF4850_001515 [Beauveria asiatica]